MPGKMGNSHFVQHVKERFAPTGDREGRNLLAEDRQRIPSAVTADEVEVKQKRV